MEWVDIKRLFDTVVIESQNEYIYEIDRVSVTESIRCLRKSFFDRKLRKQKQPVEELIDVFIGKSVHEAIQSRLEKLFGNKYGIECEVELMNDVLIGHADILLQTPDGDYIIELKTTKAAPLKPYTTHVLQANAYVFMAENEYSVMKAFIVYIPKMRGVIRVYAVEPNAEAYQKVYDRGAVLLECLRRDELPPAEASSNCWFCEYYGKCFRRDSDGQKQGIQERL